MKKLLMTALLVAGSSAFAELYSWITPGPGKWTDRANWKTYSTGIIGEAYPGEKSAADSARVTTACEGAVIEVDQDITIYQFYLSENETGDGKVYSVTLTGNGKLLPTSTSATMSGSGYSVRVGRELILDGLATDVAGTISVYGGGRLVIGDGTVLGINNFCSDGIGSEVVQDGGSVWRYNSSNAIKLTNGGRYTLNGGEINSRIDADPGSANPGLFVQNGGIVRLRSIYVTPSSDTWKSNGGILHLPSGEQLKEPVWVPTGLGATTVVEKASEGYRAIFINKAEDQVVDLGGTLIATNATRDAGWMTEKFTRLTGKGHLIVDTFYGGSSVAASNVIDVARVSVGFRLRQANRNARYWIYGPTTFGSFGDWDVPSDTEVRFYLGDVAFDTLNCFDGTTPHAISFYGAYALPGANLKAAGPGSVSLNFPVAPKELHSLTVEAGATLALDSPADHALVEKLVLGAGSTVNLKQGRLTLDAMNLEADASAQVNVTVPGTPAAGTLCPVLTAMPGASLPKIAASGLPAGWELKSMNGCAYLTDGTVTAPLQPTNEWTGAVNGSWSEPANWSGNAVPTDIKTYRWFRGARNTSVTNDVGEQTIGCVCFDSSCGPYEIAGDRLEFWLGGYAGAGSAIYSTSAFPVVFTCPLYAPYTFAVSAIGASYVALMGDVTANKVFHPIGDIRIGGTMTCASIRSYTDGIARRSRLRIVSGGSLTVNMQANDFDREFSFCVQAGGALTFAGGTNSWFVAATNTVDGEINMAAAVGGSCDQWYEGDGTVSFSGGIGAPGKDLLLHFQKGVTGAFCGWNSVAENGRTVMPVPERDGTVVLSGATVLAEPIAGDGTVDFGTDGSFRLAGALGAAAENRWTEIARVGAVKGVLARDVYKVRTVEMADGRISVSVMNRQGLVVIIK